jgi:hypothetical protein
MAHRTSLQIYRDCLRLIRHQMGNSKKGQAVKKLVTAEFKKNMYISDAVQIDQLRGNAIRGLTNYLTLESLKKLENVNERKEQNNIKEGSIIENDKNTDNKR